MRQASRTTSLIDILDRVLDKGIVIEATVRVSLIGIDLLGVDAKITVASFQTYLQLSEDPRAYEVGLLAGEPPEWLAGRGVLPFERSAVGREPEGVEPVEAGPPLGGAEPIEDPEELGKAAFREEPPAEEEGV